MQSNQHVKSKSQGQRDHKQAALSLRADRCISRMEGTLRDEGQPAELEVWGERGRGGVLPSSRHMHPMHEPGRMYRMPGKARQPAYPTTPNC